MLLAQFPKIELPTRLELHEVKFGLTHLWDEATAAVSAFKEPIDIFNFLVRVKCLQKLSEVAHIVLIVHFG